MSASDNENNLKCSLERLPQVVSVNQVKIENNIIKYISFETRSIGQVEARQLDLNDAPALFDFYTTGLSEKPKRLFAPYPLFHTPPGSAGELSDRIAAWKKEHDWTAISLVKDERIVGFCLLKRFWTEQVTSGIAIRDEFVKLGLGYLLQKFIVEQARLLKLKKFHVKIVSDNMSSMRLHEKCGFKRTRILPPPMYEEILEYLRDCDIKDGVNVEEDRHIIEMVIELSYHQNP